MGSTTTVAASPSYASDKLWLNGTVHAHSHYRLQRWRRFRLHYAIVIPLPSFPSSFLVPNRRRRKFGRTESQELPITGLLHHLLLLLLIHLHLRLHFHSPVVLQPVFTIFPSDPRPHPRRLARCQPQQLPHSRWPRLKVSFPPLNPKPHPPSPLVEYQTARHSLPPHRVSVLVVSPPSSSLRRSTTYTPHHIPKPM